eukprot:3934526-Rhodomonas_salina.1
MTSAMYFGVLVDRSVRRVEQNDGSFSSVGTAGVVWNNAERRETGRGGDGARARDGGMTITEGRKRGGVRTGWGHVREDQANLRDKRIILVRSPPSQAA